MRKIKSEISTNIKGNISSLVFNVTAREVNTKDRMVNFKKLNHIVDVSLEPQEIGEELYYNPHVQNEKSVV